MPLFRMKKVWDYCTYNKPFFILILILFAFSNYMVNSYDGSPSVFWFTYIIFSVVIAGYGMTITRDRINEGKRLPKIQIKDVFVLGVKYFVVFSVYFFAQGVILDLLSDPLRFPEFNLEDLLLEFPKTIQLFFTHNPAEIIIFLVFGSILFYTTAFFMEIALAKLADTGHIRYAFNLLDIKRTIDLIGWRNYAKDYTLIILTIVMFTALKYVNIPEPFLNHAWDTLFDLFAFATQYLGIGAIYNIAKQKESEEEENEIVDE